MIKSDWPVFSDDEEDSVIVDTPNKLYNKIQWIFRIANDTKLSRKPGFWKHYYNDSYYDAEFIYEFNHGISYPPRKIEDSKSGLESLQRWCEEPQLRHVVVEIPSGKNQETADESIIHINPRHFSKGKTWELLTDIVLDSRREGVSCPNRTLRSLKERLKKAGADFKQQQYIKLANSLKHRGGKAWTEIPLGKIVVISEK